MVEIVRRLADLRSAVGGWRRQGLVSAVVPTMGALHDGHISLVQAALARSDRVVVTIFVNPKQFNVATDLVNYPRTEASDIAKLGTCGAHLLYVPAIEEIYPPGFATTVSVTGVSEGLCGAFRPGHFDGVATVVAKLLLQTGAERAFFGEKDFQQVKVIERMVRDLDIPVEIDVAHREIRQKRRNLRLSAAERAVAPRLAAILFASADRLAAGAAVAATLQAASAEIIAAGFRAGEYLELRAESDLRPLEALDRPARLLVAAWLGETRLIDNVAVASRSDG